MQFSDAGILSLGLSLVFQDGSKVFTASCDKTAKMWDLNSNQAIQIAQVRPKLLCSFVFLNLKLPLLAKYANV